MHDFLAKLCGQLILSLAVRIIEVLWRGPRAEEIIQAIGERLITSGPWAAARSALGSIRALASASNRLALAIVYACAVQVGTMLAMRGAFRLPHDVVALIHRNVIVEDVAWSIGGLLMMEIAYLCGGLAIRIVTLAEIRTGSSIGWPAAFLALIGWGTLSFAYRATGAPLTTFGTLLLTVILCFSVMTGMNSRRSTGIAEDFVTRLLDRRKEHAAK